MDHERSRSIHVQRRVSAGAAYLPTEGFMVKGGWASAGASETRLDGEWKAFGAPLIGGLIMYSYDIMLTNFVMFPLIHLNSRIMVIPAAFITLLLELKASSIFWIYRARRRVGL
ncbi:MAG TPA: hypothetical protein VKM55_16155 [Candidatus Lokiarchaeia archaeon]|nr:hypothetical protein [Candidatus Lokiarchaeia archaeon]